MPTPLPFGSWPSPLSADAVATASPRIDGARLVGDEIWWGQTVPEEGGRTTVRRRRTDGTVSDVLPAPGNARSRVHEYGGGAWAVTDAGELTYVEKSDGRVWSLRPGAAPRPLTPPRDGVRYGGLRIQAGILLAVRESDGDARTPLRDIVTIPLDGSAAADDAAVRSLVAGSDFVAQPTLSPDGTQLAWIAWNHPDMPWDRAELRTGTLEDDAVRTWTVVAGGEGSAPLQPEWTGDDELTFLDDRTGRWNVWRTHLGGTPHPLAPADADTGGGLWVLGSRWFAPVDGGFVAVRTNGADEIVAVVGDRTRILPVPVTSGALIEDARGRRVLVSGSGTTSQGGLWLVDLDTDAPAALITGGAAVLPEEWMPRPQAVTADGPRGPVHAFAYPPTNPEHTGTPGERPPYLVLVHGGPTAHVGPAASAKTAYFTSRGIGVLDVNYGGSTGYGRAYRERLRGQWGIVDVEDVAAAAGALVARGDADGARLAIDGGSAGGWTVLAALVGTDVFSAGVARYAVGDARALAEDSHDFEARYLDGLIGPLPEAEDVYRERSPLSHPEGFTVPLLILQGAEDAVVPPAQAEAIRDALVARGIPHAYVLYEGEGHGFRRAETIVHALESELAFLGQVFGFDTPGVPPLLLS
ncbi:MULTISPECIES: prolyl oligopeptidase family serine peptidase [Microbacterium]|uniref:S9 family peptidase n=1 Tax=Microbacterium wangchenii TaxID=2541726 RepID=A0ABX5SSZ0_9MICO|nr:MULTISPECIES: prolyl oligopeptidase family serine peptidase [Microbacterium]MCK6067035.1 prolyl oligopeptidase family serine peptidase [Microbacterium sp. EYE_512]QBR88326.1 S9 family peptidase [Microbacterium wangchenii]TFV83552.1 S9 family peptidase [Microbacterium sp. dk485]TXK17883.1 S9 family peptidase [Microbacterium wangchenii]